MIVLFAQQCTKDLVAKCGRVHKAACRHQGDVLGLVLIPGASLVTQPQTEASVVSPTSEDPSGRKKEWDGGREGNGSLFTKAVVGNFALRHLGGLGV